MKFMLETHFQYKDMDVFYDNKNKCLNVLKSVNFVLLNPEKCEIK